MTREEEIENKAIEKSAEYRFGQLYSYNNDVYSGFIQGAQWADKNPKSLWISVDDDLPCNHKELLVNDTLTKSVIIRNSDGSIEFSLMYLDVEWKWMSGDNPTHWFPIPESPKK